MIDEENDIGQAQHTHSDAKADAGLCILEVF